MKSSCNPFHHVDLFCRVSPFPPPLAPQLTPKDPSDIKMLDPKALLLVPTSPPKLLPPPPPLDPKALLLVPTSPLDPKALLLVPTSPPKLLPPPLPLGVILYPGGGCKKAFPPLLGAEPQSELGVGLALLLPVGPLPHILELTVSPALFQLLDCIGSLALRWPIPSPGGGFDGYGLCMDTEGCPVNNCDGMLICCEVCCCIPWYMGC